MEIQNNLDQISPNKPRLLQTRRLAICILPMLLMLLPIALPRKATAIGTERSGLSQRQTAPAVSTTDQRGAIAAEPTFSMLTASPSKLPRPIR